jgi:beta-galactosidase GanA
MKIFIFLAVLQVIFTTIPSLGVCYYPEHWSPHKWEEDIRQMKELGLKYVRIVIHHFSQ